MTRAQSQKPRKAPRPRSSAHTAASTRGGKKTAPRASDSDTKRPTEPKGGLGATPKKPGALQAGGGSDTGGGTKTKTGMSGRSKRGGQRTNGGGGSDTGGGGGPKTGLKAKRRKG